MSPQPKASVWRGAAGAVAAITALTLLSAWPLLRHFGSSLPSDLGDPILNTWIFWWNTKAVPLTAAWWSAPMFVPMPGAFALSEALLSLVPLAVPLQWLGVSPVATHNALFLLSYPAAGLGAYLLAFTITRRRDAAFIAALAYAFAPYRIAQLSHIQMEWSCWMPLALAALHDYLDTRRARALAAFGVCWMLNGFTNGYFLVFFPILVGLWILWFARRRDQVLAIGATAALATLPIVPMLIGYARWQHLFGLSRQIGEIRAFSADLTALFAVSPRAWLPSHWLFAPGPEGELYPGLAILALTVVGVALALRRTRAGRWTWPRQTMIALAVVAAALAIGVILSGGAELRVGPLALSVHRPSRLLTLAFWLAFFTFASSPTLRRAWAARSVLGFYVVAAAAMYFFALGPEPHVGATQVIYKPPYAWLIYLPGFDSVRVPARFGLLMLLCLVQAAAIVFARLTAGRTPHATRAALAGISVAILAEGWTLLPTATLPPALTVPQRARDAGALVLEMPVSSDFEPNTIALYDQMAHGRPIVNGFSGYLPPHFYSLSVALENGDARALDAVRASGPVAAFVDAARDKNGTTADTVARVSGAELIERSDRGAWYLLPGRPPQPDPTPAGSALVPSRVEVSSYPEDAGALTDRDPRTRWHGHINQPGDVRTDTITLVFDQPVRAGILEFDQGLWPSSFPSDLEVVAITATGDVTVYRGSLADSAIRAATTSKDVVITVPLSDAPPATRFKLIGHAHGDKWTWSLADVRLFGR